MKKGEKLFIVDLETVSIFSYSDLINILSDDKKYKETPFLYLISSYVRNKSLSWAYGNLNFKEKKLKNSWMIYSFEK